LHFASFAGGDEGGYVFWLEGGGRTAEKLLGTRVLSGETLLDSAVSGGSGTSAAMTWDGPVVAYWDRGPDGRRDIALIRRQDFAWTSPRAVSSDGWCSPQSPRNGPGVAALRRQVAIAWCARSSDRSRLLVAFSSDAGRTFGDPVEVDSTSSEDRPTGSVAV